MSRDQLSDRRTVDEWNARNPVGTRVRVRTSDGIVESVTRAKARADEWLGPVVHVEGFPAFVLLSEIEPTDRDLEAAGQHGLFPDDAA